MVKAVFKLNFTDEYVFGDDGNFYCLEKTDAKGRKRTLKKINMVQNPSSRGYWVSLVDKETNIRKPVYFPISSLENKIVRISPFVIFVNTENIPKDELPWNIKK